MTSKPDPNQDEPTFIYECWELIDEYYQQVMFPDHTRLYSSNHLWARSWIPLPCCYSIWTAFQQLHTLLCSSCGVKSSIFFCLVASCAAGKTYFIPRSQKSLSHPLLMWWGDLAALSHSARLHHSVCFSAGWWVGQKQTDILAKWSGARPTNLGRDKIKPYQDWDLPCLNKII